MMKGMRMNDELLDRLTIRQLVEDWAVLRDARMWDRFRPVWHEDGVMMATWFQGPASEFLRVSREGFERGVNILHFLGAAWLDGGELTNPLLDRSEPDCQR